MHHSKRPLILLSFLVLAFLFIFSGSKTQAEVAPKANMLVKCGAVPSIYYISSNGKAYAFPSSAVYHTWYSDFSALQHVSLEWCNKHVQFQGLVPVRPGSVFVQFPPAAKIYAVKAPGVLHHISSASVAAEIFGESWDKGVGKQGVWDEKNRTRHAQAGKVLKLSDVFRQYEEGATIHKATDFSYKKELTICNTIDDCIVKKKDTPDAKKAVKKNTADEKMTDKKTSDEKTEEKTVQKTPTPEKTTQDTSDETTTQPTTPTQTPQQHTHNHGSATGQWITFTNTTPGQILGVGELRAGIEPSAIPSASSEPGGNFRIQCPFSHGNYDDPIVFPGQSGRSHLHYYFGNQVVDAHTTVERLQTLGTSTCPGSTLNRSAYWVPAMLRPGGIPVVPTGGAESPHIYYKSAVDDITAVRPMPEGLRMIAGDASATSGQDKRYVHWSCHHTQVITSIDDFSDSIPSCGIGDVVLFSLSFPQCWDGVHLDSPDHKSHMAYAEWNPQTRAIECPSSHPVPLPQVTYNIQYPVTAETAGPDGTSRGWYLSSDSYDVTTRPGGMSAHGDWFMAWDKDVMATLVHYCINAGLDSSSGNLCNGTSLTGFQPGSGQIVTIDNNPTSDNANNHAQ